MLPAIAILFACTSTSEAPSRRNGLRSEAPPPVAQAQGEEFPVWSEGQQWSVDYEFRHWNMRTRRDAPPVTVETSWTYRIEQHTPSFTAISVKSDIGEGQSMHKDHTMKYGPTRQLLEAPDPSRRDPVEPGVPYLYDRNISGGVFPWWPSLPLEPGTTRRFPHQGITQSVVLRGDTYDIHIAKRHEPNEPYPTTHLILKWRKDEPWWHLAEKYVEVDATSGLGPLRAAGRRPLVPGAAP